MDSFFELIFFEERMEERLKIEDCVVGPGWGLSCAEVMIAIFTG
jgi:hypothetical protein